jgi:hypothetical protein
MRNPMSKVVKAGFRHIAYLASSTSSGFNSASFGLHPSQLGDVASSVADEYGFYRVTRLRMRLHCPHVSGEQGSMATDTQIAALAFTTQYDETSMPGGFDSMAQWPNFAMGTYAQTPSVSMNRRQLLGQAQSKWFRVTATGSSEDNLYYQGLMFVGNYSDFAVSVSYRFWIELEGDIEFCAPLEYTDRLAKPDRKIGTLSGTYPSIVVVDDEEDEKEMPNATGTPTRFALVKQVPAIAKTLNTRRPELPK